MWPSVVAELGLRICIVEIRRDGGLGEELRGGARRRAAPLPSAHVVPTAGDEGHARCHHGEGGADGAAQPCHIRSGAARRRRGREEGREVGRQGSAATVAGREP
jgi:hypothetical protein